MVLKDGSAYECKANKMAKSKLFFLKLKTDSSLKSVRVANTYYTSAGSHFSYKILVTA